MTPIEAIARREQRIDALIDRVEAGHVMTADDWEQLLMLNQLDLMSVAEGSAREILEREDEADGIAANSQS